MGSVELVGVAWGRQVYDWGGVSIFYVAGDAEPRRLSLHVKVSEPPFLKMSFFCAGRHYGLLRTSHAAWR